jgi:lysyl-tRNA synthetase class 2
MKTGIHYHKARSAFFKAVRDFFKAQNYTEVDTPALSETLIPESCLEVFETKRLFPAGSRRQEHSLYLIPSPEIHMKKIIAETKENIYQICKCFRNGESEGRLHNSEFTMLEYYTINADYMASISITENFFACLVKTLSETKLYPQEALSRLSPPFTLLTMDEAFSKYAGFSLNRALQDGTLYDEAVKKNIMVPKQTHDSIPYDLIFVQEVEPALQQEARPAVLLDYPAIVPCLAKVKDSHSERWELYINGAELANCYTEETDGKKVKSFFESEAAQKQKSAIVRHAVDDDYWKGFKDFPPCSGVAMGLDRVLMLAAGENSIR